VRSISLWLGDQVGDWHIDPDAVSFNIVERDIWGLGKLPPADGTSLWWPTEFELSECSDSLALEADCKREMILTVMSMTLNGAHQQ
jgi:hypothetical protein